MKHLVRTLSPLLVAVMCLVVVRSEAQNKLKVSKTSMAYGSVVAGKTKADSLYVKNDSTAGTINISAVTTNTSRYTISGAAIPAALNPGDSIWIVVTFNPDSVKSYPDTLKITHDYAPAASPAKVPLSGSGTTQLTFSKSSVGLGNVVVLATKKDSFYVKNVFTSAVDISSSSNAVANFNIATSQSLPVTLNAGDSVWFYVTFTSDTVRSYNDTLSVTHTGVAASNPVNVPLSAAVVSNIQILSAVTGNPITLLTMANGFVGVQTRDSISVKNNGATTATVTGISFPNPEFAVITTTPFALTSGSSQKVYIGYTGTSIATDSTVMSVIHDSPGKGSSPVTLPVKARALANLQFSLGGVILDTNVVRINAGNSGSTPGTVFPSVPVDSPRVGLVSIVNRGISEIRVDSMRFNGPHFYSITTTPYNHRVGASYDRIIRWVYQPQDLSSPTHKDTLTVFTNDTIPGGNMLRLAVEGSSQNKVHVRSWTNATTIAFVGNDSLPIVSSTNATPIVITTGTHRLKTGDRVFVHSHSTNTNANRTLAASTGWTVTVVSATRFSLDGSVGSAFPGGATGWVVPARVAVGAVSQSAIRVYNYSISSLQIDSLSLTIGNPKFLLGVPTISTLGQGDTSLISVQFAPNDTLEGSVMLRDTVLVYSGGSATASRVALTGRPMMSVSFHPSGDLINVGDVAVSSFKDSVLKVYNRSTTPYRIDSLVLYSGQVFTILSQSLQTDIPAGDSTSIDIRFTPASGLTYNDTLYIWHNFPTALLANPRKVTLRGTGTTQQLFDEANFVTTDNATGIDGFPIASSDSSYVETGSFWQNTSGFLGTHRRAPNLSGLVSGVSAKYTIRIDNTAPYLIYHFVVNSPNIGGGFYVRFTKFGIGGIYDSLRYNLYENNSTDLAGAAGTWLPLTMHHYTAFGPGSATVTIGADNLSSPFLRVDAIRLVRSQSARDIEFGRRSINFSPVRIPEDFPQITLGEEYVRQYRLWNLGTDTLTISDIRIFPTRTPAAWFYVKNYTSGSTIKIPPMTLNGLQETGGYYDIQLAFAAFEENRARDSMVVVSNDTNEPEAYIILNGEGLNYNFMMNASLGNTEPHFRAPSPPTVTVIPQYSEGAAGAWANSVISNYVFPVPNGNSSSRVNVGDFSIGPHQAFYKFELPDIAPNGVTTTDGQYFLEFSGPITANGATQAKVFVRHDVGVPPDSVIGFNENKVGADPPFKFVGGSGKSFQMIPGSPITIEFRRESGVGAGFLRTDLLRIRKVPTGAFLGTSLPVVNQALEFGGVNFRLPQGPTGTANKRELSLKSIGESQLLVKTISFKSGQYYRILTPPPTPLYLRAVNGELKLNIEFTPDKIQTEFRDTLVVESNSVQDSVMNIPMLGSGVGAEYSWDDDALLTDFSSVPSISGIYAGTWNVNRMTNWQTEASNVQNTIGFKNTRQLLPIYFNGNGSFEWYPKIPAGPSSDSMYLQVSVVVAASQTRGSPAARYKVYSALGVLTKDTVVNQNGQTALTSGSTEGLAEISLGGHWFLRDGQDVPGSRIFGTIRLENDTAAVTAYYSGLGQPNAARRDTFGLIADAVILRELQAPTGSLVGVGQEEKIPTSFALSQNYPNPFNPTTTINFDLPQRVPVDLRIYDLLGREVRVLINNEEVNPGYHKILWDGRNNAGQQVATGVYFYRIIAGGGFVKSKKMLLIK